MAERGRASASVRLRTTAAATLVVAVALGLGALALVALVRDSLHEGVESTAERQLDSLVAQVESGSLPLDGDVRDEDEDDPDDDVEELVWQVRDEAGAVLAASQPLTRPLPARDDEELLLPGADHRHLLAVDQTDAGGREVEVVVAVSLEEVEDSTDALVPPLLLGLPVLLLLVAGTTWVVTGRALAPVERIRREVEQITGDRLGRRVPEPRSRDEVHRLARTMNQMLGRLQVSHDRQRQFVADASHELRSPLAGIRQTAEVASAHPGALAEGELAEAVLEEAVRMQHLVEQLLLLTRVDAGAERARQEVDLDDLVLAEVRRSSRHDVRIDATGVGPARVLGDPVALGQVVRNLVDNAVRHARTTVALTLREEDAPARDGTVVLVVEDDGPGIPPAEREHVFERFVRLDEARARDAGGSGLGLAIVRSTVDAHGGHVAADESRLGGARLTVRLPGVH